MHLGYDDKIVTQEVLTSNLTSQMIADRSLDEEAKYFPLWENCTNQTSSSCASNTCLNISRKMK